MLKKIKRVLCVVFLFLSFSGFAEKGRLSFSPEEKTYDSLAPLGIRKLSGTAAGKTQSLNFSLSTGQLKWQTVNRRDLVTAEGFDFVTPPGSPMVPAKIFAFSLPQDAVVTGVDVANVRYREILNSLDIAPAPNPVRITPPERIRSDVQLTIPLETTEQEQGNFYGKDEAVYSLESFYPGELVQWETGKDNERTAVYVRLFPVQYNPSQKTSFVVTSATITVYYESSSGTAVTGMSTTMGTTDYELLIITPRKYRDLARKLQEMHRNDPFSPLYTCYVYLEDIENYYFRPGAPYLQPDPGNPPYDPHPQNVYPDMGRTTARKIIRFLGDMAKQYQYAPYGILHPVPAVRDEVKFQYVLILGRGDAVPPSWYPYYPQYTDLGWLATDFFYASPSAPSAGISYDLLPEFSVGRIPVVEEPVVKTVYTVNAIHYGNLTITTNTSLPVGVKTGDLIMMMSGTARSLFFEITQITDNSPDSFTLTVKETDPGPEAPENIFGFVAAGNTYQFHINVLNNLYTKQQKWLNEISTTGAWTNWFRNVAVAGGPPFGTSFYWHELAANQYINNGHLEHNRILKKLFRTGEEDSDFDPGSIEPFLNNTVDTGLFYIGCHGSGAAFVVDRDAEPPYNPSGASPAYITSELIKNYTSSDSRLPIIVSPSCFNAIFDPNIYFSVTYGRSLGEAVVNAFDETTKEGGTGIAYIGWSREGYATVDAYFDKGVINPTSDNLDLSDQMLNWTLKYWKAKPSYIGDIFVRAIKGTNQTSEDCYLARNDMSSAINRYVLFGYTLLGNPGLSVVYDGVQEIPSTGTRPPVLEPVEDTLRPVDSGPLYESHDIPVDMIPAGGTASTTIKITPEEHPVATAVESEIKIRKVDALEVPGRSWYSSPATDFNYVFDTEENKPGYYMIAVTQKGWDYETGAWGDWWEKESRIYVQEVNEFLPSTENILLVDDDYGFPLYLRGYLYYIDPVYYENCGYEDFYQQSLINLAADYEEQDFTYDVWHVDFDDLANYPGNGDYNGADVGYTRMYGEITSSALLDNYGRVIWQTGNNYYRYYRRLYGAFNALDFADILSVEDRDYLKGYLDAGGKLFMSGQDILYTTGADAFAYNYLKVSGFYASIGDGGKYSIEGVVGDAISDGFYNWSIAGGDGANNQYVFTTITPSPDGVVPFDYIVPSGGSPPGEPPYRAATYGLAGEGATVFFPWGWESIDRQPYRDALLYRVLHWLDEPTVGEGNITSVPGNRVVNLSWTVPVQAQGVVIYYSTQGYPSGLPVNGQQYGAGDTIAGGTVIYSGTGATTFQHTGLTNGTTYYYVAYWYVAGYQYMRLGDTAATPTDSGFPGIFTAAGGAGQVLLNWSMPSGATGVLIFHSTTGYPTGTPANGTTYTQGQVIGTGTVTYSGGGTAYVHLGLPPETTYYYVAFSYDAARNYVSLGQASATTSSETPSFTAIPGDGLVQLIWTVPEGRTGVMIVFRKYEFPTGVPTNGVVYAPGTAIGDGQVVYRGTDTSSVHDNLTNGDTYYYVAYSYDGANNYYYLGQVNATPTAAGQGPDGIPENLTAIGGKNKITLFWQDKSTNEYGFIIERKTATTDWEQIDSVQANVETYTDRNVTLGLTYWYRVRAFNAGGYSDPSNEKDATAYAFYPEEAPQIISLEPSLLTVGLVLRVAITVRWIDNSVGEDGFQIWRKDGVGGSYRRVGTVGPDEQIFVDTDGLMGGTQYFYKVRAMFGTYYAESLPVSITPSAFPPGQDPDNLRATRGGPDITTVQWNDNSYSPNETYFRVQGAYTANFELDDSIFHDTTVTGGALIYPGLTYLVTNIPDALAGRSLYFRVRAYRTGAGYSHYATVEGSSTVYIAVVPPFEQFSVSSEMSSCFIATAAFGTPMAEEVVTLRNFRDKHLLTNRCGRAFVRWYYRHSPAVANYIRNRKVARALVRTSLRPLLWILSVR